MKTLAQLAEEYFPYKSWSEKGRKAIDLQRTQAIGMCGAYMGTTLDKICLLEEKLKEVEEELQSRIDGERYDPRPLL